MHDHECELEQYFNPLIQQTQYPDDANAAFAMAHEGEYEAIFPLLSMVFKMSKDIDALRRSNETLAGLVADKV